jgi:hypothetical protein
MNKIEEEEKNEETKFEKYLKMMDKLLGNISFISELFLLRFLPLKVMRFINYHLIQKFIENFFNKESRKARYPIYEQYLEALIKLYEFAGSKIEEKEKRL